MTALRGVFVVGRFSPLHHGHLHLLRSAARLADALYILSYARPEAPGCPANLRREWLEALRDELPTLAAIHVLSGPTVPADEAAPEMHRDFCADVIEHLAWPIDAVATSEAYGPGLAAHLARRLGRSIKHFSVDPDRTTVPISATQIRQAPDLHAPFLSDTVRRSYRRALQAAQPQPGHPRDVLPTVGLSRADLYDAFLGRPEQVAAIVGFVRRLGLPPGARVLDAGCGTGRLLLPLTAAGFVPTGLDADPDYVARARRTGVETLHGRFEDLHRSSGDFDAALLVNGPLVYLPGATARRRALTALRSALKPGAHLVVDCPDLPWIATHGYQSPEPQTRTVAGFTITRTPAHDIDRDAQRWTHTDHHHIAVPHGPDIACVESFTFSMATVDDIETDLRSTGFTRVTRWTGWTASQPGAAPGPRMLLTACRPPPEGASPCPPP